MAEGVARSVVTPARDAVIRRVRKRARHFPDLDIRPLDVPGLGERDAALAIAIDHAVTRRWMTLAAVIDACLDQDWTALEAAVQAPLLVGAAQLLFMERIPDHAVISESVAWAGRGPRPRSRGLVNAVLRAVAGARESIVETWDPERRDEIPLADGRAWRLTRDALSEDPFERLSQATSCGRFLLERWLGQFGADATAALARHTLVRPPVVLTGVVDDDPSVQPHDERGFVVYDGPRGGLEELLRRHPDARVQDVAAAAPIQATSSMHPRLVVDFCAGLGTKTRQLARLHPETRIVATDADPGRREELDRLAAELPAITAADPRELMDLVGQADLLVLDVPCSNTGVLARRLEARYRLDTDALSSLVDLQRQIVADALPLLAPGGTLLYATCSIDHAENEDQVRWVGKWHGLEPAVIRTRLPQGVPGDPPARYSDGGFFALVRAGGANC